MLLSNDPIYPLPPPNPPAPPSRPPKLPASSSSLRAAWKDSKSVIHSLANSASLTSVLLKTKIIVLVDDVLGVSMIYAITVGKVEAKESNKMLPEALQTKTSI
ncbi:hypothetical protein BOTCAL_0121g00220 [Botryotinia calthae]|uniref:Uncharacterized protein n=1 Tax=Botryotinia calthae TaxID=38488 RepID=A0A4Y8D504_9HELO|nr:hypothetical protein BOTCAL_0121g00220 [Botryotinia calthae]